ncbi:MAG: hypothetical protein JWO82_3839, partial [Akkermansiaceae bacterium]|nr:hypothetical protein [Akkermansiaceae bacterium]
AQWLNLWFGNEATDPTISGWDADPDSDGLSNLQEWAFNLSPAISESLTMSRFGTRGLPRMSTSDASGSTSLSLQYLRLKKEPGITYHPEFASSPSGEWLAPSAASSENVEPIDQLWERVTVTEPALPGVTARFARVRLELAP